MDNLSSSLATYTGYSEDSSWFPSGTFFSGELPASLLPYFSPLDSVFDVVYLSVRARKSFFPSLLWSRRVTTLPTLYHR